jgi:aminopeptidase
MNAGKMEEYARLVVGVGLKIVKGQTVMISAPVECAEFTRLCVKACYEQGCREVIMQWGDDYISREKYLHAEDSVFDECPDWMAKLYDTMTDIKAAKLAIIGGDPENLKGVDPSRIQRYQRVTGKKLERYYKAQTTNEFQWCVAACPTEAWARKVFPEAKDGCEAVEKLWDAILYTVRVDGDGTAAEKWKRHTESSKGHIDKLNSYRFKYLKYKNSLGSDFTVELPEGHYWSGASELASTGAEFVANIPTEEVFTVPKRDGVNGVIAASMPLVLNGNIVDKIRFTLKDGKITEAKAETGEKYLLDTLEVDEGARYLGEVALVQHDSPISRKGILFYNTLFDENASCHLAFGEAYPLVHGAEKLSADEQKALGINQSYVHEDFMIGTEDLSIIGVTKEGEEIQVFAGGNFAF